MDESRTLKNQHSNLFSPGASTKSASLDRLLKNPKTDMLLSALPYVSNQMEAPLALAAKILELNHIMETAQEGGVLKSCGFEKNAPDPEAMLRAMKMAGGSNAGPQIDQMLNMLNLVKTYQTFNDMLNHNPEMVSLLHSFSKMNQTPSPSDLLHQVSGKDTGDLMKFLTQMLNNG